MKKWEMTPALENELKSKIDELDSEERYIKLFLNTTNRSSVASIDPGEKGQVGVTVPQFLGATDSFITNPSNVGIGILARMLETDPTVLSAVQFKSLMMLAKIGEYQNENEEIAEFVRDFISKMYGPTWKQSLEAMSSHGGYGFSISEIIWGLNKESRKVPVKVKTYHPSTICFEVDGYGDITPMGVIQFVVQFSQLGNPNQYAPTFRYGFSVKNPFETPNDHLVPHRMPFLNNYGLTRIPLNKCIHHVNNSMLSFGSPYGKSPVRTAHLAWQMKVFFTKQLGIAGKRQASPFIHGTAPMNQNAVQVTTQRQNRPTETPMSNANVDPKFLMNPIEALSAVLASRDTDDSVITGPESAGYKLNVIAANMDLNQYLAVLNWLDVQIFRAFLLPSLVMTDGSAGSRALGDKHFQVVDRIAEEEAQVFSQTLIDQLIRPTIVMNFGEQDAYGHFAQRPQNIEERERLSNMFSSLASAGFMKAYDQKDGDYVRSTLHLPEQDELFYAQGMPNFDPLDSDADADESGEADPNGPAEKTGIENSDEDTSMAKKLATDLMGIRKEVPYKEHRIVIWAQDENYSWKVEKNGVPKAKSSSVYDNINDAVQDAKDKVDQLH